MFDHLLESSRWKYAPYLEPWTYLSNVVLVRDEREAVETLPGDEGLHENVDFAIVVLHAARHLHLARLVQQTFQLLRLLITNLTMKYMLCFNPLNAG